MGKRGGEGEGRGKACIGPPLASLALKPRKNFSGLQMLVGEF
jgi:hypothetical protein